MLENIRSNLKLRGDWLTPSALEVGIPRPQEIDQRFISIIVGTDTEASDVFRDWEPDAPESYRELDLTVRQRRKLQRRRLYLRNRRIVCGYELLDQRLRAALGKGDPDEVPPTWLTIGKWTALVIGDLLNERLPMPTKDRTLRIAVWYLIRRFFAWRTIPMGRLFVMGNREIFAQVASALVTFLERFENEEKCGLPFPNFVMEYSEALLGAFNPNRPDELLFPIRAVTPDPLSDSLLRALWSYYRARGSVEPADRAAWVLAGNLHLASYEQHIAQTFVELALSLQPGKEVKRLLQDLQAERTDGSQLRKSRPLDMLLEENFVSRLLDLTAAAFATRFIVSLGVGRSERGGPASVFAPAQPLEQLSTSLVTGLNNEPAKFADVSEEAAANLQGVWFALDRAKGLPVRSPVQDWRNFYSRVSYIANLFAVSGDNPFFLQPVFSADELLGFLRGELPVADGVKLTKKQREAALAAGIPESSPGSATTSMAGGDLLESS